MESRRTSRGRGKLDQFLPTEVRGKRKEKDKEKKERGKKGKN